MTKNKYWKHPMYGMVFGNSVPTPIGRLSWPYLTKPKAPPPPQEGQPEGQPRYECTLLIEKAGSEAFVAQLKEMTDEMLILFNKGRPAALGTCMLFGKYGDGDEADLEKYPNYKGCWVLVARNSKVVKTVGKDRKAIETDKILGGMKGKFVITPLITAHGISYKLEVVQLVEDDGVRFGGATRDAVELLDACVDADEPTAQEAADTALTTDPVLASQTATTKVGKEAALDLL